MRLAAWIVTVGQQFVRDEMSDSRRLTDRALSCAPPVKGNDTPGGRPANRPPSGRPLTGGPSQAERRRRVSCSAALGGGRGRRTLVERLVHAQRSTSWKRDVDEPTPWLVVDRCAGNAQLSHLAHELLDIPDHQVELVLSTRLGRMKRDLSWREAKD